MVWPVSSGCRWGYEGVRRETRCPTAWKNACGRSGGRGLKTCGYGQNRWKLSGRGLNACARRKLPRPPSPPVLLPLRQAQPLLTGGCPRRRGGRRSRRGVVLARAGEQHRPRESSREPQLAREARRARHGEAWSQPCAVLRGWRARRGRCARGGRRATPCARRLPACRGTLRSCLHWSASAAKCQEGDVYQYEWLGTENREAALIGICDTLVSR